MGIPIVAVVNQKGGVGKTATTLGLASAVAYSARHCLVVDLDPQANATTALGVDLSRGFTTDDVLAADAAGCAIDAVADTEWGAGVLAIPSTLSLAAFEQDASLGSEQRLRKALQGVGEKLGVDVILIDCPPSVGRLVSNGLVAATTTLVVTEAAAASISGVENLVQTVNVVREYYNPDLAIAGVIVNRMPTRQREAATRLEELSKALGSDLWEPVLPARAAVAEAMGNRVPFHSIATGDNRAVADIYDTYLERLLGSKPVLKAVN